MSRWGGKSNEDVYEILVMGETTQKVDCGVMEWVKHSTLRWLEQEIKMNENETSKRV